MQIKYVVENLVSCKNFKFNNVLDAIEKYEEVKNKGWWQLIIEYQKTKG